MRLPPAILLVESDRRLGEALAQQLAADGFRVELASNPRHARMLASDCPPRVALIGTLQEPRGALALLEEIRDGAGSRWDRTLPALVMSAVRGELDAVRAFEAGADDFVAMPVAYLELRARLRALLRRSDPALDAIETIDVGELHIDLVQRSVTLKGRRVDLRRMEYELLCHLAADPHRAFSREELLLSIWGFRAAGSTRTIDSHASRLRRNLGAVAPGPWLVSVWGVGYRLI